MYSVWVFVLLGAEGIKAFKANPYFTCANLHPSQYFLWLTSKCKYWHKSNTNVVHSTPGTYLRHRTRTQHILSWPYLQPWYRLRLSVTTLCNVIVICYVAQNVPLTIPCVPDGLGYLNFLAPPEKVLRWIEDKMNLLGRLPHYVSMDQKIYGRYGVLPTTNAPNIGGASESSYIGSTERLGP